MKKGATAQFISDVRARMEELGLTQRELARRMKTGQGQIARLLTGKQSPTLDTAERIAKELGRSVKIAIR